MPRLAVRRALVGARREAAEKELVQRPLRLAARRALRVGRVEPGIATIVTVNWNSVRYLATTLRAVERFTPEEVRLTVVDNHSSDASATVRATFPRARWIGLPTNVGHEVALDVGFLLARSEYVVSLDVDAFPIAEGWLERLLEPLSRGYVVSGAHVRGGFVHPCCLAMRLDAFVEHGHTFQSRRGKRWARDASDVDAPGWDTGWRISLREPKRFTFDRTAVYGPGDIGSVWEGLVYHNFYATRFDSKIPPPREELDLGVTRRAAEEAWARAVGRYLGPT
jgi:glycosyltransferase involved in cell wall biosynthesis